MLASDILLPVYSSDKSVGSSISLVVLSDTETEMTVTPDDIPAIIPKVSPEAEADIVTSPTGVLDLTIYFDIESNPSEDSPSLDHALVALGVSSFFFDDHFEFEPLEDSSKEDALEPHEATIAWWRAAVMARSSSSSSSFASTPPTSLWITPAPPRLPRLYVVFVLPGRRVSPDSSLSVSPLSSSLDGPSCKGVDLLPPHKRLRGLPSAFHQETSIEDSTERGYEASMEGSTDSGLETDIEAGAETGTKVGAYASVGDTIKIVVDVMAKPDTPLALPNLTITERLDDHEEVI
ncbi:hypothetical protein Tco_0014747 [Tanacetum coccineum]